MKLWLPTTFLTCGRIPSRLVRVRTPVGRKRTAASSSSRKVASGLEVTSCDHPSLERIDIGLQATLITGFALGRLDWTPDRKNCPKIILQRDRTGTDFAGKETQRKEAGVITPHESNRSVSVQSVQLEHRDPMRTLISLQGNGSPKWARIDLTGRPSPALEGRHVALEPARVTPGGALGDAGSGAFAEGLDMGALVEATVLNGGELPTIRLVWFGRFGKTSLDLHECNTSLASDEFLHGDSEKEKKRRKEMVSRVGKWLQGWAPNFDRKKPPLTLEETVEEEDDASNYVPLPRCSAGTTTPP